MASPIHRLGCRLRATGIMEIFRPVPRQSKKLRQELFNRSGGRCFFCGTTIPEEEGSVEHLVPRHAPGSTNTTENCVWMCKSLNRMFGNLGLVEKIELMLEFKGISPCPRPGEPNHDRMMERVEEVKRRHRKRRGRGEKALDDRFPKQLHPTTVRKALEKALFLLEDSPWSKRDLKDALRQVSKEMDLGADRLFSAIMHYGYLQKDASPGGRYGLAEQMKAVKRGRYWISKGGIRHNPRCRHYMATPDGYEVEDNSYGRPCSQCGG